MARTSLLFALLVIPVAHPLVEEKFNVYALEKGVIVEEKVDVKPEDGTIEIAMPAHNNLDKMTLISDFKSVSICRSLHIRTVTSFLKKS